MVIIGTWNLENLVPTRQRRRPPDQQAYAARLEASSNTVTNADPDVLAVQEGR
ncbi:hypothetical protein [Amycolatopsis sp. lyj-346]|uniref:hypothetical protein n=1 Tax=Amycolatopsis sp. lyj-346 TaxID=2789289 RepID=UPI00397D6D87